MIISDSCPHNLYAIVLAYKENVKDIIWVISIHLRESYAAMYFTAGELHGCEQV